MPKPDPAQLDPERYPFQTSLETRFGDLDVNRHLNNVALASLIEETRVRFHQASGFHEAVAGFGAMVVSLRVEYLGQGFYPEPVTVHAGAATIGRSSYQLDVLIAQGGRMVCFAQSVMVCTSNGQPSPIPDSFRESAKAWMVRT